MAKDYGSLDASIQEKLDADTDFATSLESLSDEDKEAAIDTKKTELYESHVKDLSEKAEKLTKAEEIAENQKKRAEKAEAEAKKNGKKPDDDSTLSQKDLLTLSRADIHDDDVDEVLEYSRFKKISVADALKSSVIKTMLAEHTEERKTADATDPGKSRRVTTKQDDSALMKDLSKGNVPEPGSEEAERLFWARRGGKPKGGRS